MRQLIKLVKFKYKGGQIEFQTFWDDVRKAKEYIISGENSVMLVSKELGNEMFKSLREMHPDGKVLVLVDAKSYEHDIKWYHEYGHYVIDIDGKRYCTCDTIQEVREELKEIQKNFAEKGCQPRYNSV